MMETRRGVLVSVIAATLAAVLPVPAHATETHTLRFGPVHVGPYQAVKHITDVRTPAVTGSIVSMDAQVVDASGNVIPQSQVMLHHLVFFNRGRPGAPRRDGTCLSHRAPERFYGTSEELQPMTLPAGYGYRVDRRERWRAAWMLMNHTSRERSAWIRYRVTVDTAPAIRPVQPYWVSIVACGADPQYSVPGTDAPGSESTRRTAWRVPVSGRIVAVGGHLHGGARRLTLSQPRCGGRTLVTSRPTYGPSDDPVYQVKPLLHEPDPLNISWWQSSTGIPVREGEPLALGSHYDGGRPHMRVMGIAHVYLAPDAQPAAACGPLPADAEEHGAAFTGRPEPPTVGLTLARVGSDGRARPISAPRAPVARFDRSASVKVKGSRYRPQVLSIPLGGRVRWLFRDHVQHDVTLVSGPTGFASPWARAGGSYARRFTTPGIYRLQCSLHPAWMSQLLRVRAR